MYFLKKFTNFGNRDGCPEDVSDALSPIKGSQNGNELAGSGAGGLEAEDNIDHRFKESGYRRDSASSVSSNFYIDVPDCFFDDLSETTESEDSDTAESTTSDEDNRQEGTSTEKDLELDGCNSKLETGDCRIETSSGRRAQSLPVPLHDLSSNLLAHYSRNEPDMADFNPFQNESPRNVEGAVHQTAFEGRDTDQGSRESHVATMQCQRHDREMRSDSECEILSFSEDLFKGESETNAVGTLADDDCTKKELFNENGSCFIPVESDSRLRILNDQLFSDETHYLRTSMPACIQDYLDKENYRAEARLAARRQARVEAREIRLRELERQQKEQEESADRAFDASYGGRVTPSSSLNPRERSAATINSYHSGRRSSEDSLEEGLTLRDIRHELKEAEEKFKKAMIANAQLDNEKSALVYQVELLKDRFEDLEETQAQLTREHRDKCREHEQLKRAALKLKEDLDFYKMNLLEREKLIADYGLVIVDANIDGDEAPKRTLISNQSAELLKEPGCGSLDMRLKKFAEERNEMLDEIRHLKLELEEERRIRLSDNNTGYGSLVNGPLDEETGKILSDYKFKLQKAEQDVSTLQANVARLESQVIRYKTAAESSEKAEDELKIEKRKLQRENRESIARIEELETANSHLQRRMDKLKNAKSTLLKEL